MKNTTLIFLTMLSQLCAGLERIVFINNTTGWQMQLFNHHTHELKMVGSDTIAANNTGNILPNAKIIPLDVRVPWADVFWGMRNQYIRLMPIMPNQPSPWVAFIGAINGRVHTLVRKLGQSLTQASHLMTEGSEVELTITTDGIVVTSRSNVKALPNQTSQADKEAFLNALGSHAYFKLEGEANVSK